MKEVMAEQTVEISSGRPVTKTEHGRTPQLRPNWIGGAGNRFCRRTFVLTEKPVSGRLQVWADPHSYARDFWMCKPDDCGVTWLLGGSFLKYRLWLNGEAVGAGPFRSVGPGMAVLHEFEVGATMRAGRNVLGAICRGEKRGVGMKLIMTFADGHRETLVTDSEWRMLDGNAIFRPICWEWQNLEQHFKGFTGPGEWPEHLDGTKFPFGWLTPEYDDSRWEQAEENGVVENRAEAAGMANYVQQVVEPVRLERRDDGGYVIDFGREVVAALELDSPPGGGTVEIRLGEELLSPDRVRFQMRTENCYQELWTFPAAGGRLANFGLRAFRYAEILGWHGDLQPQQVRALVLNVPFRWDDAAFSCSDERLERIWNLCRNSIAWTSLDVYTDCPSRERIAYEADAYITMLTHFGTERNTAIARRTLEYLLYHATWPCEWRQFMIPLFYEYLMHTGDFDPVAKHYETLKTQFSFHALMRDGLIREFPFPPIIDWPENCRDGYEFGPANTVANAFAYWDLTLLAELARYLDRNREADEYRALARELKAAFHRELFDPETGRYRDHADSRHGSFHASMFALAFGLVPDKAQQELADYLVKRGMCCSVYAAQFYLEALFKSGRAEAAVALMTADNDTSWLGMIRRGATLTTESWTPEQKPNMSWAHPWGSAPGNIIPRYVFGLRPTEPGWRDFVFEPRPGGLDSGRIMVPTPRGRLVATFQKQGNEYRKNVELRLIAASGDREGVKCDEE